MSTISVTDHREPSTNCEAPLNVLHAFKVYLPDVRGGIPRAIQQLTEGMKSTCRTSVLATRERGGPATISVEGMPVHRSFSFGTLLSMPIAPFYPIQLWRMARRADLVAYHAPFPLIDLTVSTWFPRRCGLVVHWHADITEQRRWLPLVRGFIRRTLRRADRIIATSPVMIENSEFLRPIAGKCEVVPYGIDVPYWTRLSTAEQEKVAELRQRYPRLIVAAGRLVRYKGFESLIASFAKVEGHLTILGAGPLEAELRSQIAALGLQDRVRLAGTQYEADEFKCLLHASRLFVLPSISASESFAIVQLEAMACGRPIVNTSIATGVSWVARNGREAITVRPNAVDELADAINTLLDNEALAATFGQNATRRAAEFTEAANVERIAAIYRTVVAERRQRGGG